MLAWLRADGWEIFTEVPIHGGIADVVGKRPPLLLIVELKTALTFDLLAQCRDRRRYAHVVYGAVPSVVGGMPSAGRSVAYDACRTLGVGLLTVGAYEVRQVVAPALRRRVAGLGTVLGPEYQRVEPGTASPSAYLDTPFKRTCRELQRIVRDTPGISVKAAVTAIGEHHYNTDASAISSLPKRIRQGLVPGVRLEREGRRVRLFPAMVPDGGGSPPG